MDNVSRRSLLKRSAVLTGTGIGLLVNRALLGAVPTPSETEGPFYPDMNNDLTTVKGASRRAEGQVIFIRGTVKDPSDNALSGARIEIWQACATGKYDSPGDPNPAKLDPNFQYWGKTVTDAQGSYGFKTIKPGSYPATPTWRRPPHIHVKVFRLGFRDLTTQMYFTGESLNDQDLILNEHSAEEKKALIVNFVPAPELEKGALAGQFNIVLTPVG